MSSTIVLSENKTYQDRLQDTVATRSIRGLSEAVAERFSIRSEARLSELMTTIDLPNTSKYMRSPTFTAKTLNKRRAKTSSRKSSPYCLASEAYPLQAYSFGTSARFPNTGHPGGPGGRFCRRSLRLYRRSHVVKKMQKSRIRTMSMVGGTSMTRRKEESTRPLSACHQEPINILTFVNAHIRTYVSRAIQGRIDLPRTPSNSSPAIPDDFLAKRGPKRYTLDNLGLITSHIDEYRDSHNFSSSCCRLRPARLRSSRHIIGRTEVMIRWSDNI